MLLQWSTTYENFNASTKAIESDIITLITDTFKKNLNSSESAFDLLNKFKNIKTRDRIEKELLLKYTDVLGRYKEEIAEMRLMFDKNREDPPIPKNMPPNSGKICWSRSIISRIKSPIDKFKTKVEILTNEAIGKEATKNYVETAKLLTETYEAKIFEDWKK